MNIYNLEKEEVLNKLNTSKEGLTEEEVDVRRKKDGLNKLKEAKKESKLLKFLNQFKNLMILVLFLALVLASSQ